MIEDVQWGESVNDRSEETSEDTIKRISNGRKYASDK